MREVCGNPRFLPSRRTFSAEPRNDRGKSGASGWHRARERGIEGYLGGVAIHNDSVSRLGGGGGAGAGVESECEDEESAGSCADRSEDAGPFKSAEKRTNDRADGGGDGGDEVLYADPQTRHQDGQNAGQDNL